MEPILLYDTTLRDGTQGENINFSAKEKIQIAKHLHKKGGDIFPDALERCMISASCVLLYRTLLDEVYRGKEFKYLSQRLL